MIGGLMRDPLEEMHAILSEQRVALRTGEVQALADLVPRMEKAMSRVAERRDPAGLSELRRIAAENAALLRAAADGVAQVRALRRASSSPELATYTAGGALTRQTAAPGRDLRRR